MPVPVRATGPGRAWDAALALGQGIRELGRVQAPVRGWAQDLEWAANAAPVSGQARDVEPARVARPDAVQR